MSFTLRLLRSFEGAAGAIILTLLAVTALAAPLLFPGDPLSIAGEPLIAPFSDAAFPSAPTGWAAMYWRDLPTVRRHPCSSASALPLPPS